MITCIAPRASVLHGSNSRDRIAARRGHIVTLDLNLTPEHGFVPERLFDQNNRIQFVLGWGNYLPGLHQLVEGCVAGDSVHNVSLDAGWGERRKDLLIAVPRAKIDSVLGNGNDVTNLSVGMILHVKGVRVTIDSVDDDKVVLDANPPLAGSSYSCSLTVISVEEFGDPACGNESSYQRLDGPPVDFPYAVATFALGCFWGGELAFMRQLGVVGTQVGYTQGTVRNPTYEQVSRGGTSHREAVLVVYDARIVSYETLLHVALDRLAATAGPAHLALLDFDNDDDNHQYRHGFYYHGDEQRITAQTFLSEYSRNRFDVQILPSRTFYPAEEHHQQYLYKGGQSARKGAKETIRCFG